MDCLVVVSTHIWMRDGVLSLNGISLRTRGEELIVILLRHRGKSTKKQNNTDFKLNTG